MLSDWLISLRGQKCLTHGRIVNDKSTVVDMWWQTSRICQFCAQVISLYLFMSLQELEEMAEATNQMQAKRKCHILSFGLLKTPREPIETRKSTLMSSIARNVETLWLFGCWGPLKVTSDCWWAIISAKSAHQTECLNNSGRNGHFQAGISNWPRSMHFS